MAWPDDDLLNEWTDDEDLVAADMYARTTERMNQLRQSLPKIAAGKVTITPVAGTPTSVAVSFPAGLFDATPNVQVSAFTSVPGTVVEGVSYTGVTATGCTIWLTRTNTSATDVYWLAVEA